LFGSVENAVNSSDSAIALCQPCCCKVSVTAAANLNRLVDAVANGIIYCLNIFGGIGILLACVGFFKLKIIQLYQRTLQRVVYIGG
jgi:hypothetical protein